MLVAPTEMKSRRGTKRVCRACEERFYDLDRDPMICPSCKTSLAASVYAVVPQAAPTGYQSAWGRKRPAAVAVVADDAEAEAVETSPLDDVDEAPATGDGEALLDPDAEVDDEVVDLIEPGDPSKTDE